MTTTITVTVTINADAETAYRQLAAVLDDAPDVAAYTSETYDERDAHGETTRAGDTSEILGDDDEEHDAATCDECGAAQPADPGASLVAPWHGDGCSLHPSNVAEPAPSAPDEDDRCAASPTGRHVADWATVSTQHDGGDHYVDIACRHCGRSGCVGTSATLAAGIDW